ncbi:MAG: hypothetical protein RM368_15825 [Nostoc sp. DedSLP03]|uniref:hypothetical protein n=1 Tax=Nostoc sp. DedSLP03 TaxID=3075400 RepID=UPI002AD3450F|nr:hypothetical protein [Nostoc sp. DedSLP03]MDZ7966420.1 hypothetical protein [Nostoc sp. DedSLP03]
MSNHQNIEDSPTKPPKSCEENLQDELTSEQSEVSAVEEQNVSSTANEILAQEITPQEDCKFTQSGTTLLQQPIDTELVEEKQVVLKESEKSLLEQQGCVEATKDFTTQETKLNAIERINKIFQEHEYLKKKVIELERECDELKTQKGELLVTISEFARNKSTTYVSGDRPQNHILVHEFIQLKDQNFQSVSTLIFHHNSEINHSFKANRRQEIAKIKSTLSEEILVKQMKTVLEDSTAVVSEIINSIYLALGINNYPHEQSPKNLHREIENLIHKGLNLIFRISSADPPGDLWMEQKGIQFDPQKHQPFLDCDGAGQISFTVYPGYRVNNRIFEKALVFTTNENI